jgi:hypothetical protein
MWKLVLALVAFSPAVASAETLALSASAELPGGRVVCGAPPE